MNLRKTILVCLAGSFAFVSVATAQVAIQEGPLPTPLVSSECVLNDDAYFGWDGEQSCSPTNVWFYGADYPLSQTGSDVNGDNLAWSRADFLNKTVRCDVFKRNYQAESGYEMEIRDITFLDIDNLIIEPDIVQFPDATAHTFTRGWRIGEFGHLNGVYLDFNSREYTTEQGYLFVYDADSSWREPDKDIATHFGHCYLRDEAVPLRASKYCVDYDGDGTGWNGTESCSVQTIDPDCDYSKALDGYNQGWGYNPATGQSCPPIAGSGFSPEDECLQNSDNGWGWNAYRQESCQVD